MALFPMSIFAFLHCLCLSDNTYCAEIKNPEAEMTTGEFIQSYGYPFEEHQITAPDGAITVAHRIPYSKNESSDSSRIPVIVHHGIVQTSIIFVDNLENNSFGFFLVNNGYDVWLANMRGNQYSNRNLYYNITNPKFWDFSFQESGEFDIPLLTDYILEKTGHRKILYIGYSLGTTIGFTFLTSKPEYNDKLYALVQIAPVTLFDHSAGVHKGALAILFKLLTAYQKYYESHHILAAPLGKVINLLYHLTQSVYLGELFERILFDSAGDNVAQMNQSRFDVYASHVFDRTSMKVAYHTHQMMVQKKFQKYDYGEDLNWRIYNQSTPPQFNMKNIKIPVGLFWSSDDKVANPWDTQLLAQEVPNVQYSNPVTSFGFGHLSFLWSRDAKEYIYNPVLQFMRKILKES